MEPTWVKQLHRLHSLAFISQMSQEKSFIYLTLAKISIFDRHFDQQINSFFSSTVDWSKNLFSYWVNQMSVGQMFFDKETFNQKPLGRQTFCWLSMKKGISTNQRSMKRRIYLLVKVSVKNMFIGQMFSTKWCGANFFTMAFLDTWRRTKMNLYCTIYFCLALHKNKNNKNLLKNCWTFITFCKTSD